MGWHLIYASSSKPFTSIGKRFSTHSIPLSLSQLCNFSGASYIRHVKKPLEMSQSFVSACIWAILWVLLSPQPEAGTFTPLEKQWWAHILLQRHTIDYFGSIHSFKMPHSHHALCFLAMKRAKEELHQGCNVSTWLWGFVPVSFS